MVIRVICTYAHVCVTCLYTLGAVYTHVNADFAVSESTLHNTEAAGYWRESFSRCAIAMLAVVGLHHHHWKDLHVQAEGFVRRPQVLCHIFQHALKVTHSAAQRALMCGRGAGA